MSPRALSMTAILLIACSLGCAKGPYTGKQVYVGLPGKEKTDSPIMANEVRMSRAAMLGIDRAPGVDRADPPIGTSYAQFWVYVGSPVKHQVHHRTIGGQSFVDVWLAPGTGGYLQFNSQEPSWARPDSSWKGYTFNDGILRLKYSVEMQRTKYVKSTENVIF